MPMQGYRIGRFLRTIERGKFTNYKECEIKRADGTWRKVKVLPDHVHYF